MLNQQPFIKEIVIKEIKENNVTWLVFLCHFKSNNKDIFSPFHYLTLITKNCNSLTKGTKKNWQGDTFMVNIINNPNMYRIKKFEKQY